MFKINKYKIVPVIRRLSSGEKTTLAQTVGIPAGGEGVNGGAIPQATRVRLPSVTVKV